MIAAIQGLEENYTATRPRHPKSYDHKKTCLWKYIENSQQRLDQHILGVPLVDCALPLATRGAKNSDEKAGNVQPKENHGESQVHQTSLVPPTNHLGTFTKTPVGTSQLPSGTLPAKDAETTLHDQLGSLEESLSRPEAHAHAHATSAAVSQVHDESHHTRMPRPTRDASDHQSSVLQQDVSTSLRHTGTAKVLQASKSFDQAAMGIMYRRTRPPIGVRTCPERARTVKARTDAVALETKVRGGKLVGKLTKRKPTKGEPSRGRARWKSAMRRMALSQMPRKCASKSGTDPARGLSKATGEKMKRPFVWETERDIGYDVVQDSFSDARQAGTSAGSKAGGKAEVHVSSGASLGSLTSEQSSVRRVPAKHARVNMLDQRLSQYEAQLSRRAPGNHSVGSNRSRGSGGSVYGVGARHRDKFVRGDGWKTEAVEHAARFKFNKLSQTRLHYGSHFALQTRSGEFLMLSQNSEKLDEPPRFVAKSLDSRSLSDVHVFRAVDLHNPGNNRPIAFDEPVWIQIGQGQDSLVSLLGARVVGAAPLPIVKPSAKPGTVSLSAPPPDPTGRQKVMSCGTPGPMQALLPRGSADDPSTESQIEMLASTRKRGETVARWVIRSYEEEARRKAIVKRTLSEIKPSATNTQANNRTDLRSVGSTAPLVDKLADRQTRAQDERQADRQPGNRAEGIILNFAQVLFEQDFFCLAAQRGGYGFLRPRDADDICGTAQEFTAHQTVFILRILEDPFENGLSNSQQKHLRVTSEATAVLEDSVRRREGKSVKYVHRDVSKGEEPIPSGQNFTHIMRKSIADDADFYERNVLRSRKEKEETLDHLSTVRMSLEGGVEEGPRHDSSSGPFGANDNPEVRHTDTLFVPTVADENFALREDKPGELRYGSLYEEMQAKILDRSAGDNAGGDAGDRAGRSRSSPVREENQITFSRRMKSSFMSETEEYGTQGLPIRHEPHTCTSRMGLLEMCDNELATELQDMERDATDLRSANTPRFAEGDTQARSHTRGRSRTQTGSSTCSAAETGAGSLVRRVRQTIANARPHTSSGGRDRTVFDITRRHTSSSSLLDADLRARRRRGAPETIEEAGDKAIRDHFGLEAVAEQLYQDDLKAADSRKHKYHQARIKCIMAELERRLPTSDDGVVVHDSNYDMSRLYADHVLDPKAYTVRLLATIHDRTNRTDTSDSSEPRTTEVPDRAAGKQGGLLLAEDGEELQASTNSAPAAQPNTTSTQTSLVPQKQANATAHGLFDDAKRRAKDKQFRELVRAEVDRFFGHRTIIPIKDFKAMLMRTKIPEVIRAHTDAVGLESHRQFLADEKHRQAGRQIERQVRGRNAGRKTPAQAFGEELELEVSKLAGGHKTNDLRAFERSDALNILFAIVEKHAHRRRVRASRRHSVVNTPNWDKSHISLQAALPLFQQSRCLLSKTILGVYLMYREKLEPQMSSAVALYDGNLLEQCLGILEEAGRTLHATGLCKITTGLHNINQSRLKTMPDFMTKDERLNVRKQLVEKLEALHKEMKALAEIAQFLDEDAKVPDPSSHRPEWRKI